MRNSVLGSKSLRTVMSVLLESAWGTKQRLGATTLDPPVQSAQAEPVQKKNGPEKKRVYIYVYMCVCYLYISIYAWNHNS